MTLCDIHLHKNAEHRGGDFTTYAGNGDGQGYSSGFRYDGELTAAETASVDRKIGESEHGDLYRVTPSKSTLCSRPCKRHWA